MNLISHPYSNSSASLDSSVGTVCPVYWIVPMMKRSQFRSDVVICVCNVNDVLTIAPHSHAVSVVVIYHTGWFFCICICIVDTNVQMSVDYI